MASVQPRPNLDAARTASVLNVIAGIWLIISPFILAFATAATPLWNTLIVGVIVLILAGIRASDPRNNIGLSWVNLLLGIWLIISPWVLHYGDLRTAVWNDVILGIIVGILAIWSAVSTPGVRRTARW